METLFTTIVVVGPLIGTFFPLEVYFGPQSFSLQSVHAASDSTFTSTTVVTGVTLAAYLLLSVIRWSVVSPGLARNWPLFAFTLLALASAAWAAAPGISFNRGVRLADMVLIAVYLIQRYSAKELVKLLTVSFLIFAFLSVAVVALAPGLGLNGLNGYFGAWRGATTHKNSLGAAATIGLIVSAYSFRFRANPIIALPSALILLLLLVMAQSATAAIAMIGATLAAIYLSQLMRARRPIEKLFFAVIGVLLLVFGAAAFAWADELLALVGRDASFTGRANVWAVVQVAIEQKPIWGYGHGFWQSASPMLSEIITSLNWGVPQAHNMWLDIRLQLGAVGLAAAIGLWLIAGKNAVLSLLFSRNNESVLWSVLLIAIFLRAFSETELVDPAINGMFWFSLGYAGLAKAASGRQNANSEIAAL